MKKMKTKKKVVKKQDNLKWFCFDQNNSGGSFVVDKKLCHKVYIQAYTQEEALEKGIAMGIYLDGVENDQDCACCGDRWYEPHEVKINEEWSISEYLSYQSEAEARKHLEKKIRKCKSIRGITVSEIRKNEAIKDLKQIYAKVHFANILAYVQFQSNEYGWTKPDARLYYANGTVKEINKEIDNED